MNAHQNTVTLPLAYLRGFPDPWRELVNQVNAVGFPLAHLDGDAPDVPPQGPAADGRFAAAAKRVGCNNWSLDVNEAHREVTLCWWA